MDWLNAAVQGLLLGGLYALFAAGLSLVFGTMRLTNIAHGDLSMLAAYGAILIVNGLRFNPFYAIPVTMAMMFIVGYCVQRGVINRIVLKGNVNAGIIVTFGISMVIQNALLVAFSANPKGLDAGKVESASIRIAERLAVGWLPVIIFGAAVVSLAGLQVFLWRTRLGRAVRAVSDNQEAARVMGIDPKHVWAVAMGGALLLGAIGGVLMGIRTTFDPMLGIVHLLFAFEAVVIGGLGSVWGTLIGGMVLGLAQTLGAEAFGPSWSIVCGHVVFILLLIVRPQGLLPKAVTT